tara:strand:- start:198 stop:554 length:357 start_codon:yes stop_codon:yes gene_type:complete
MCALNEVKQYLSQTTERGQGSSPKVLIEAIMSISKLSVSDCDDCDCFSSHQIPHNEISLRRSMIIFLKKELESLKEDENDDAWANHYIEAMKWVIRLGRVLTTRDEQNPKKKHFGKRF